MFTQVYFRAQEILGFLSGFTEGGPVRVNRKQLLLRSQKEGGSNEKQRPEVDSEQLKSEANFSLSLSLFRTQSRSFSLLLSLSLPQTHTRFHACVPRAHTHTRSRSNDLGLLAQFVPFLGYFCSRQICFPVITTPFHLPVLNHTRTIASARARTRKQTRLDARKTPRAHKQAGAHTHEQAWVTLELFEEWGTKPIFLPNRLSPPELFYSYQQIGGHQLFTSVKAGTLSNTELQPESERSDGCGGLPRQPDNERVYQPISNPPLSFCQPAWLSCVHTLVPCCLTAAACWMFHYTK